MNVNRNWDRRGHGAKAVGDEMMTTNKRNLRLAELAKHRVNGVERRIDLFSDLRCERKSNSISSWL